MVACQDASELRAAGVQVLKRGQTVCLGQWAEGGEQLVKLGTSVALAQYVPAHSLQQLEALSDSRAQVTEVLRYGAAAPAARAHTVQVEISPPYIRHKVRARRSLPDILPRACPCLVTRSLQESARASPQ